ncbi:MAG: rhodanese-like domain-containing protein [Rhodospirillaceae bacterium]
MKRRFLGLISLIIGALSLSAATAADGLIAADDALAAARRGDLLIIDVRTPAEWRQTGIAEPAKTADFSGPGGIAAFVAQVAAITGGDLARPIAVICRSGNRSARAAAALRANGFTAVSDIGEGMAGGSHGPGWLARSLPVTTCPTCQ